MTSLLIFVKPVSWGSNYILNVLQPHHNVTEQKGLLKCDISNVQSGEGRVIGPHPKHVSSFPLKPNLTLINLSSYL